jgi:hypothetical protein
LKYPEFSAEKCEIQILQGNENKNDGLKGVYAMLLGDVTEETATPI